MARVGVDIDGVLYPFEDELRNALVRGGYRTEDQCPTPTHWHFYEDWKMSREWFVAYCDQFTNDRKLFWHGEPYPGVVDQMRRLREAGHTIVLITSRNFGDPGVIEASTAYWLDWEEIPHDEIHFVEDKRTVEVDYHVDDNFDHYTQMREKGVRAYLLTQPWNENDLASFRVKNLGEYVDYVLRREGSTQSTQKGPSGACVECGNDDPREGYNECGDCQEADKHHPLATECGEDNCTKIHYTKNLPDLALVSDDSHLYWANERHDILKRFTEELTKVTGDGSKKRQAGEKPPWYKDGAHEGAIFSHLTKWKRGELVDPDSGAHPLVHLAWRALAIACQESGNVPE